MSERTRRAGCVHGNYKDMCDLCKPAPSSFVALSGSVTVTYQQLKNVLENCRHHVESAPGEDPPDGYESLEPAQAEIADACWHRGMEQLSTALLNWCHDQLKAQSPNARADLPPASDAARDSGTESANGG